MLGQAGISVRRQRLDFGQRGRRHPPPGRKIVKLAFHTNVLGHDAATTKRLTPSHERATVYRCGVADRTQNMPRNWTFFAVLALIVAISAATWAPASAEVRAGSYSYEFAAQSRPRITCLLYTSDGADDLLCV